MNKQVLSFILKFPLILVVISSFFASIYAAIKSIGGIGFGVPVILFIVLISYFYGENIKRGI